MSSKTVITAPEGQRYLTITRTFKAPAALLLRAHLEPELVAQWMGPRNLETVVVENDARHGGKWRFIHKDGAGNEYGFRGVFHGDPSVDGMMRTFEFEGYPGQVQLESLTFEEKDSETTVHVHSVFTSQEGRDGMVQSGMEEGVVQGYERLDALLIELH